MCQYRESNEILKYFHNLQCFHNVYAKTPSVIQSSREYPSHCHDDSFSRIYVSLLSFTWIYHSALKKAIQENTFPFVNLPLSIPRPTPFKFASSHLVGFHRPSCKSVTALKTKYYKNTFISCHVLTLYKINYEY